MTEALVRLAVPVIEESARAAELLALLRSRLHNDPATERAVLRGEGAVVEDRHPAASELVALVRQSRRHVQRSWPTSVAWCPRLGWSADYSEGWR